MPYLSRSLFLLTSAVALLASPALARRTAIDQIPDPSDPRGFRSVGVTLSGYCDLQGDDCDADPDQRGDRDLGYQISFDGGASFFDRAVVQGNGLLTFGQSIDFNAVAGPNGETARELIEAEIDPSLVSYDRTLISAGQNNYIDNLQANGGPAFYQSARLALTNDTIVATWFSCPSPFFCYQNPYTLFLTPTAEGLRGQFRFGTSLSGTDRGYVVGGQYVATGDSFLIPATFRGAILSPVPEPASWMMAIVGFGMIGGAVRRRGTPARQIA